MLQDGDRWFHQNRNQANSCINIEQVVIGNFLPVKLIKHLTRNVRKKILPDGDFHRNASLFPGPALSLNSLLLILIEPVENHGIVMRRNGKCLCCKVFLSSRSVSPDFSSEARAVHHIGLREETISTSL